MAIRKSQIDAVTRYTAKHYDRMVVTVPKGERDKVKEAASHQGESMNTFIVTAINERIERLQEQTDRKD